MIEKLCVIVATLYLVERLVKWLSVVIFFRRGDPDVRRLPGLISVLQPILSGDPTLPVTLAHNLHLAAAWPVEFLWLIDDDDPQSTEICRHLVQLYPQIAIRVISLPRPNPRESPKIFKLREGLARSNGDTICVLDDDTMLPKSGFQECLNLLNQPQVGLSFGLPYYVNFASWPASLVSVFVNSNSLLTYIPYTFLTNPFTINGMFYVVARDRLEQVGGFAGLEPILADDFAIAQRFRSHGFRLAQSRLRHGISTHVDSFHAYFRLLQRWLIFPRETLMKRMKWRDLLVAYCLAFLPSIAPAAIFLFTLLAPTPVTISLALSCVVVHYVIFLHFNVAYLRSATPWRQSWLVVVLQLALPLQLALAVMLPQRINWRGHLMRVERGGTFQLDEHRNDRNLSDTLRQSEEASG